MALGLPYALAHHAWHWGLNVDLLQKEEMAVK